MQSNKYHWNSYPTIRKDSNVTFTIRSLKQGATGARKTWPSAPVLLDYLVSRNGLHPDSQTCNTLDMTDETPHETTPFNQDYYNIVELGAGTGYLGIGLALSLNHDGQTRKDGSPKLQIMCTDSDTQTLKNMRYNVHEQRGISKAVRVQCLSWGDGVGGDVFSTAVDNQFGSKIKSGKDPLRLVTHLVASDVHFGSHTLEPLSSVISAFKLRSPGVIVIVLLKERNPEFFADVTELKERIEAKVEDGRGDCSAGDRIALEGFCVRVRNVLHDDVANMKLIEC